MPERAHRRDRRSARRERQVSVATPSVQAARVTEMRILALEVLHDYRQCHEVGLVQTKIGESSRTPHVSRPTETLATNERVAALRRRMGEALKDADEHVLDALASLKAADEALRRPFRERVGGMKDNAGYAGAMPPDELADLRGRAEARRARGEE